MVREVRVLLTEVGHLASGDHQRRSGESEVQGNIVKNFITSFKLFKIIYYVIFNVVIIFLVISWALYYSGCVCFRSAKPSAGLWLDLHSKAQAFATTMLSIVENSIFRSLK